MPAAAGEAFAFTLCFPRRLASHSGILQRLFGRVSVRVFSFNCNRMWVSILNRTSDLSYQLIVPSEVNVIVMYSGTISTKRYQWLP